MTKMVDAGHFDSSPPELKGKPTKKNLRKETALVAVEDESESKGEDEKLALPSLKELLREQGYIHLNVGAEKAWDGDTVSVFGFGCLHVGRAQASHVPNGVVFACATIFFIRRRAPSLRLVHFKYPPGCILLQQ